MMMHHLSMSLAPPPLIHAPINTKELAFFVHECLNCCAQGFSAPPCSLCHCFWVGSREAALAQQVQLQQQPYPTVCTFPWANLNAMLSRSKDNHLLAM